MCPSQDMLLNGVSLSQGLNTGAREAPRAHHGPCRGLGWGDVCGPGPPTMHCGPRWLPAATGNSATEGLNF